MTDDLTQKKETAPLYAEVIVDISLTKLDRTFCYRVPPHLMDDVCVGGSVRVPFGKGGRPVTGCVVALTGVCTFEGDIKEITEVVTDETVVEPGLIRLAAWMRERSGSTMNQALRTVLPWRRPVRDRVEKTVRLLPDKEAASDLLAEADRRNRKAQARALRVLIERPAISWSDLLREADVPAAVLNKLRELGIIEVGTSVILRTAGDSGDLKRETPPALTADQEAARDACLEEWAGDDRPCLIFGVTGSGKTLIYMDLIERILAEGRQAIVLIPEIALTYQTVERFRRRFGSVVSFLHSRLSDGEKYDQFRAARQGLIKVMVGPRSALFTPFPNLGIIVVDEEHEESYHSEHVPRYHAREAAEARAEIEGAHLILGSATPSMVAYRRAETGQWRLVGLKERFGGSTMPETVLVDMRQELREGNRSIISGRLRREIALRLERGQQSILFLNRRGLSGFVTCRSCGHVEKCPHCDVSLTQHRNGRLICHYCGYERPMVRACPECGSTLIGGLKIGTERVEDVLKDMFPGARILRMDRDTTRGKGGHEEVLKAFAQGEADILLGTQMIVKGHDFPRVTLAGILLADLSLNDSDYRSSERTFELITQAVGRAGRGRDKGLAVIQSYETEHFALQAAAEQDYPGFYKREILYRRLMNYPPIGRLVAVIGTSKNEGQLISGMRYLREFLKKIDPGDRLKAVGPAPMAVGKVKDTYRYVLYIRHRDEKALIGAVDRIDRYVRANSGFEALNIQFDFNA